MGDLSIQIGIRVMNYSVPNDCEEFTIPDHVTELGEWEFFHEKLKQVIIHAGVTTIMPYAFSECDKLIDIQVAPENSKYQSIDGILYDKEGTALLAFPSGREGVFEIPDGVKHIETGAFWGCIYLTEITIPDSVTDIGIESFWGCWNLTQITIPGSVKHIGVQAFSECESLINVTISEGVQYIHSGAFEYTSISQILIPSSVISIDAYVFSDCDELTAIYVADTNGNYKSVDGILYSKDGTALIACPGKKTGNLDVMRGVTTIGMGAFWGCKNLTSITIPEGVTSIEENAFAYCTNLSRVSIPSSVSKIEAICFEGDEQFTIYTPKGSYAERYAKEHNIPVITQ